MTTAQFPSPDTPGRVMYPHEIRVGDFVYMSAYARVEEIRATGEIITTSGPLKLPHHGMVEVVR